jgi:hypothetical protein
VGELLPAPLSVVRKHHVATYNNNNATIILLVHLLCLYPYRGTLSSEAPRYRCIAAASGTLTVNSLRLLITEYKM